MLSKFTPFGKHDSGKTTVLRVLTYLLYSRADPAYYVHFQRANQNGKGGIYNSPASLPLSSIFKKIGKDKSADWRISFNVLIPTEGVSRSVRISICTPGDVEEEIVKNWDFSWNNYIYKLSPNEPTFIKPDFFISPCSDGRAIEEEKLEQSWHIQNGNRIDFLYWFRLPIEERLRELLSKINLKTDFNALLANLESYGVFDAGKRKSSVAKMTHQNKIDSITLALLIENKIFELANLL